MKSSRIAALVAAIAAASAISTAASAELRLGFVTTLTGGGAFLGNQQANGWKLALEHEGWTKDGDKIAGVPTKVFYGDDRQDTDSGLNAVRNLLGAEKVHIVAGIVWSNVLMAVKNPVIDAKRILMSTNAGASPMAGKECSLYFISTSWNNDQQGESSGALVEKEGVKSVFLLSPNYQAGKDMLTGFQRYYKGKVIDTLLYKLGSTDFQAEISKVRAAKPAAVFVFAPGAMGPAFVKQWAASGAGKEIKLYSVHTIDWVTLPAIGDAGIGAWETIQWSPDLDNEVSKKFVKDYIAKFGHTPSNFAQQAYDAPRLIAAAVKAQGGKIDDIGALMRAMRKVEFPSARGPFKYNVNGFPIQNFYKVEVVKGSDGKPTILNRGIVTTDHKDSYWEKCPADKRT